MTSGFVGGLVIVCAFHEFDFENVVVELRDGSYHFLADNADALVGELRRSEGADAVVVTITVLR